MLALLLQLLLAACGGGDGSTSSATMPAGNAAPIARAGIAQTVTSGSAVTLDGSASSDTDGSISAYAWTQVAGAAVTLSNATTAQPGFVAPQVAAATVLSFSLVVTDNRGAVSSAASVSITVNPPLVGNVTVTGIVRFMDVPFQTGSPFGLNYGAASLQPSRGVIVQAVDAASQAVLATGVTGADGGYSLSVAGNTSIVIRLIARLQKAGALPTWDVRVQDGVPGTNPFSYTSAAFNSSIGARDIDIPLGISASGTATGERASGPFAILDTIYTAMQTVLGAAPAASLPALIIDWGSQSKGTFFQPGGSQHIALMSDLTEDTDEFDQHVIAHEYGHYLENNFSRSDSIGGDHALGDRLDPRVAFGEGWGYAFSAIALGNLNVRDSFVDNGVQRAGGFNIEANPPIGGADGPGCWCSESTVWAMLWDIYDSNSDAFDSVSLGFQPIWNVLTTTQKTTPALTTLFSFIEALKAANPAAAAGIDSMLAAQNIDSPAINAFAIGETHAPFANILPIYTSIVPGTPVVLRSTDDGGYYNKAGNHRFLRFVPATSGQVTMTLATSNPNPARDPDFRIYRSGVWVVDGTDPPTEYPETETFNVTAGQTYIIDAYDCANGCQLDANDNPEGTPGDYDLTVTIN